MRPLTRPTFVHIFVMNQGIMSNGAGNNRARAINLTVAYGTGDLSDMPGFYYVKNAVGGSDAKVIASPDSKRGLVYLNKPDPFSSVSR